MFVTKTTCDINVSTLSVDPALQRGERKIGLDFHFKSPKAAANFQNG